MQCITSAMTILTYKLKKLWYVLRKLPAMIRYMWSQADDVLAKKKRKRERQNERKHPYPAYRGRK